MAFCTRCGTSIEEESFCPSCGLSQSDQAETPDLAEDDNSEPAADVPISEQEHSPSRVRRLTPWLVAAGVLVFALSFIALSAGGSESASEIEQLEADLAQAEQARDRAERTVEKSDSLSEELRTELQVSENLVAQSQSTESRTRDELDAARSLIVDLQSGANVTSGSTLATVRNRGRLICGVSGTAIGFSEAQADGSVIGFDADYCRAVAAAVLGDKNAVEFRALTAAERFEALKNNIIDILIRNTTWTQSRDIEIGLQFAVTTYYDGQQLLGNPATLPGLTASSGFEAIDGATVCANAGTTTEKNIVDGAQTAGLSVKLERVETFSEAMENFKAGVCDIVTTDGSGLFGIRSAEVLAGTAGASDWVIFPQAPISKEPLGPVVRQNDDQWLDIVNWVVLATLIADENGVTSASIDDMLRATPELTRLFGGEGEIQSAMGLSRDAFYRVIRQVGNYDEIFRRNLTEKLGMQRSGTYNELWFNGGLLYAPPAR